MEYYKDEFLKNEDPMLMSIFNDRSLSTPIFALSDIPNGIAQLQSKSAENQDECIPIIDQIAKIIDSSDRVMPPLYHDWQVSQAISSYLNTEPSALRTACLRCLSLWFSVAPADIDFFAFNGYLLECLRDIAFTWTVPENEEEDVEAPSTDRVFIYGIFIGLLKGLASPPIELNNLPDLSDVVDTLQLWPACVSAMKYEDEFEDELNDLVIALATLSQMNFILLIQAVDYFVSSEVPNWKALSFIMAKNIQILNEPIVSQIDWPHWTSCPSPIDPSQLPFFLRVLTIAMTAVNFPLGRVVISNISQIVLDNSNDAVFTVYADFLMYGFNNVNGFLQFVSPHILLQIVSAAVVHGSIETKCLGCKVLREVLVDAQFTALYLTEQPVVPLLLSFFECDDKSLFILALDTVHTWMQSLLKSQWVPVFANYLDESEIEPLIDSAMEENEWPELEDAVAVFKEHLSQLRDVAQHGVDGLVDYEFLDALELDESTELPFPKPPVQEEEEEEEEEEPIEHVETNEQAQFNPFSLFDDQHDEEENDYPEDPIDQQMDFDEMSPPEIIPDLSEQQPPPEIATDDEFDLLFEEDNFFVDPLYLDYD